MSQTYKNAVILARVSSKAQEDEGYSLESQLKLMNGYCSNKGLDIVKVFRIAETASKEQGRDVFKQLTRYIKQNKIYNLVVEKTDRLTRNLRDAVVINDWLNADSERYLHIVKENLLLHKEARSDVKFMWNIHLAVAKKFTDNLREEAMKGWAEKLAQGWMPGTPPSGYVTAVVDGKKIHIHNPKTANCIKRAFRLYLEEGQSITTVTEALRKMNVTSRKGRPLPRSYIEKILKNPFYMGVIRFNGKEYPGAQKPLITQELFESVQAKLGAKRCKGYTKHCPLFKGLMTCKKCQKSIIWSLHKGRYYGRCAQYSKTCKGLKYLREDKAEEIILEQLKKLICPSKALMAWLVKGLNARKDQVSNDLGVNRQEIEVRLKRLRGQADLLYEDRLAGYITLEKYQTKHGQIQSEIKALEDDLDGLEGNIMEKMEDNISILRLTQEAVKIYKISETGTKRLIITSLFDNLETAGPELKIHLTKLSQVIADKSLASQMIVSRAQTVKNNYRTAEKTPINRCEEGQLEALRPIWQGRQDSNLRPPVLETGALNQLSYSPTQVNYN